MVRKFFKYIFFFLVVFFIVLSFNFITFGNNVEQRNLKTKNFRFDSENYVYLMHNFAKGLTFQSEFEHPDQVLACKNYLIEQFENISGDFIIWNESEIPGFYAEYKGTEPELDPLILIAHFDVVSAKYKELWKYPPFAGTIAEEKIWGRGAIDDKLNAFSMLSAFKILLDQGFKPKRSIIFAFGGDEEVGGKNGAKKISEEIYKHYQNAWLISAEGMAVTDNILPKVSVPVAFVGLAEKGMANFEIIFEGTGGHSSLPHPDSPLLKGITFVENLKNFKSPYILENEKYFKGVMEQIVNALPFEQRLAFSNWWLFKNKIKSKINKNPALKASTRTTFAVTSVLAGENQVKNKNIIPQKMRVGINVRIAPWDSIAKVKQHLNFIAEPLNGEVHMLANQREATPMSSDQSTQFHLLKNLIPQVFPRSEVATAIVLGGSDAKHFKKFGENIFRFTPVVITPDSKGQIHGNNEHISIESFWGAVKYYGLLIKNSSPE